MNVLAFDTSQEILSVAVRTEKGVYAASADAGPSHSELLFDAIDGALRLARLTRNEIELIACMEGPGSFTGLRIGFAAAKGLSLALGKPYIAVPALDCIAASRVAFAGFVLPLLDARQNRFFCRLYKDGEARSAALDTDATGIAALLPPGALVLLAGPAGPLALKRLRETQTALPPLVCDGGSGGGATDLLRFLGACDTVNAAKDDFAVPLYIRPAV